MARQAAEERHRQAQMVAEENRQRSIRDQKISTEQEKQKEGRCRRAKVNHRITYEDNPGTHCTYCGKHWVDHHE